MDDHAVIECLIVLSALHSAMLSPPLSPLFLPRPPPVPVFTCQGRQAPFHHRFEGPMVIPSPGLAGSSKPLWLRSHVNHYLEPQVTVGCQNAHHRPALEVNSTTIHIIIMVIQLLYIIGTTQLIFLTTLSYIERHHNYYIFIIMGTT